MTGTRCAIYDKIDKLDEARSVADLVARLKPILLELAYFAVTGEGAVMETHEEWHTTFTDRLYEATGAEARAAGPAPALVSAPASAQPRLRRPQGTPKSGKAEAPPSDGRSGASRRQQAPPGNRPRPEALTPALLAIMAGTHQSLQEDDG
jgi:hypothetical protein